MEAILTREVCEASYLFGEVLKDLLFSRQLTQRSFGGYLGYSDGAISKIIDGNLPRSINLTMVMQIIEVLDCDDFEQGQLIVAFGCSVLKERGLFV